MENEKIMKLDNGVELPYLEFGEQNEEVLIVGQYYFMTFIPWLKNLAEYFHVYAVTMRTHEPITEELPDGKADWITIWAEEFYEFAQKKGIKQFYYAGKCHGSTVGWELLYRHSEVLKGFVPLSLLPVNREPGKAFNQSEKFINVWKYQSTEPEKFVSMLLRSQDLIEIKVKEMQTADISGAAKGRSSALAYLKTNEELFAFYDTIRIPILLQYGMEDPGFQLDWFWDTVSRIPNIEVIMYQGERHFYEMDIPEKLAYDTIAWAKRLKALGN